MVFLRGLIGYWACMNGLALGYVINSPASELQHVFFSPSRFSDSIGSLLGISKRPSDPIVPPGLEDWIQEQRKISFGYLLDNIAPNGANAKDAAPGSVIASPSKHAPNYYYQWVRDAAITMGDVVEAYANSGDEKYKHIIDAYADLQGALQNTFNPSGGYTTGGLGEPKFQVDGAPFTEFVSSVVQVVRLLHDTVTDRFANKGTGHGLNGMALLSEL
jgi:glucoamylase